MTNFLEFLEAHKDFPRAGVRFYCIARLLREQFPAVMRELALQLRPHIGYHREKICFAGIESRGFLLAAGLAAAMSRGVVLIRKKGKLPGIAIASQEITLEYGQETLEVQYGNCKVILCDDVLATGGTLLGAEKLLTRAGYDVVHKVCLLNLKHLNTVPADDLTSLIDVWN